MQAVCFYLLATLTVLSAVLVIANPFSRSPVTSAMCLVLTIVWLAGLFVMLHAYFLAAVQVLVYAGAVMVLFLFVIMLLDLKAEERRRLKRFGLLAGAAAVATIGVIMLAILHGAAPTVGAGAPALEGAPAPLGELLFKQYLLPFEVVSVVLLVAMLGVVLLSKKGEG